MRSEDLILIAIAAGAAWWIVRKSQASANARGLSADLLRREATSIDALFPDTEAGYLGTWTANGPLNMTNYNKQIFD